MQTTIQYLPPNVSSYDIVKQMNKIKEKQRGVAAIALLAAIYGLTAVLARYLSSGVGVFEQWYIRYFIALCIAFLIFRTHIRFRMFLHLPLKEWAVILFRNLIGSVIAVSLYTIAAQESKIGPVAFMQVVPTTAVLGVLIFKEKITWKKALIILLSFAGAASVAITDFNDLLALDRGAVLSLISGALFGLTLLTRKWHGKILNNYEIVFISLVVSAVMNYILSLFIYQRAFVPVSYFEGILAPTLVLAGLLSVAIHFLANYGFERVEGVTASVLLNLEIIFGPLFGYLFYKEMLTKKEFTGGIVILVALTLMNILDSRTKKIHKTERL